MVLGVYLTLDQGIVYNGDYSDVSGFKLTGTVYSDINKTTAFNLTGYTITLQFFKNGGFIDYLAQTCTITVAASGTFYLSLTDGALPFSGIYEAKIELTKSGTKVRSLNRVEVLIERGPQ